MAKKPKTKKELPENVEVFYQAKHAEITAARRNEQGEVVGNFRAMYDIDENKLSIDEEQLYKYRRITPEQLEDFGKVLIEIAKVARSNAKF